jgi:ABC-type oligopeptide transport system substrate-binding subunit
MTGGNSRTSILWLLLLFLLFVPLSCVSEGKQESSKPSVPEESGEAEEDSTDMQKISGRISMKGSMPNTYLALTTGSGKEYKITGPLEEKLAADYQYEDVTLSGEIVKEAVGPGFPAEFRAAEIISSD